MQIVGVIILGKIKIHELAKKIEVNSKEVLEKALELGLDVKSHMSSIDEADAKKIEAKIEMQDLQKEKEKLIIIQYIETNLINLLQ